MPLSVTTTANILGQASGLTSGDQISIDSEEKAL
jgi:hypothetical protein